MKDFLLVGIVLFLLMQFESCKKKSSDGFNDTLHSGIIKIAANENFKYLVDSEIDAFEAHSNYAAIIYPIYSNEKDVIRLLIEDSVRLAIATRDLNAAEQKIVKEKNMVVKKFLIAFEGIALVINKTNTDSIIGFPALKKIFTGEITEWSQINPNSPFGTVLVFFDGNQSGIVRYIADSIAKTESLSSNLYALENSDELLKKVCELPNSIGVLGYNQISNEYKWKSSGFNEKLRLMRVGKEENPALQNTFLPYAGDLMSGDYPLWRPVYVLLSDPRSGLPSGFSIFLAHDVGQTVILQNGLLPAVMDRHRRSVIITDNYPQ